MLGIKSIRIAVMDDEAAAWFGFDVVVQLDIITRQRGLQGGKLRAEVRVGSANLLSAALPTGTRIGVPMIGPVPSGSFHPPIPSLYPASCGVPFAFIWQAKSILSCQPSRSTGESVSP